MAGALAACVALCYGYISVYINLNYKISMIILQPAVEEATKTVLALFLNTSIVLTHGAFGLVEGLFDYYYNKSTVGASVFSLGSHIVFGIISSLIIAKTGRVIFGIIGASIMHMAVNYVVIVLVRKNR